MLKRFFYLITPILFLMSCEKAEVINEGVLLENDYIETDINGNMVRFDAFRFGLDQSYFRKTTSQMPSELKFTRTLANGLESITVEVKGLDLDQTSPVQKVAFGRAANQGQQTGVEVNIELASREATRGSHCPGSYLNEHSYDLDGTLYIDAWSEETGILEGRFEAEGTALLIDDVQSISDETRQLLREGYFRVWLQSL